MSKTDPGIMCNCSHDKLITVLLPLQRVFRIVLTVESLDVNFVTKICGLRTFFVAKLSILSQRVTEKNHLFFMLNLIKFKCETKELKFL